MKIETESLAVVSVVVATYAMRVSRVQGFFNGSTTQRWLQLHDAKAVPANGAVPLRSWPLYTTAPFDQNFQNDGVELAVGCTFVVSTTQATLTISADTMDIYVNGTSEFDVTGAVYAGDYTTPIESLNATPSGTPKTLKRVEVTTLSDAGSVHYLKGFAYLSVPVGTTPLFQVALPRATSVDVWFDVNLTQRIANVQYNGIFLIIDSVPDGVTFDYAGTDFAIKATMK